MKFLICCFNPNKRFLSHTLQFSFLEVWFGPFKKISFMFLFNLMNIWNTVKIIIIITVLMHLSVNYNTCVYSGLIPNGSYSPHDRSNFLLLCMPGNLWLDLRHCDFYLVYCWIFLHSYKYSWCLFLDVVKLFKNNLIIWGL